MSERQILKHITFVNMAFQVARLSRAKRAKVGSLIVRDNRIISTGYNGSISGISNECEKLIPAIKAHPEIKGLTIGTDGKVYQNNEEVPVYTPDDGYPFIAIGSHKYRVHQLVADTYILNPDPEFYTEINHIDRNTNNNRLDNLELCSHRYNELQKQAGQMYMGAKIWQTKGFTYWRSRVRKDGKQITKTFKDPLLAQKWYIDNIDPRDLCGIKNSSHWKTLDTTLHSEETAILFAASNGINISGCTMYVTHQPCFLCMRKMAQVGIREIYYRIQYPTQTIDKELIESIGIKLFRI